MAAFRWLLYDASGDTLRATEPFSSKEDAEAWMGDTWMALLEEGAESVSLVSDGNVVYRMGLREQ